MAQIINCAKGGSGRSGAKHDPLFDALRCNLQTYVILRIGSGEQWGFYPERKLPGVHIGFVIVKQ